MLRVKNTPRQRSPDRRNTKNRRRAGRHPPMHKRKSRARAYKSKKKSKTCMTLMEVARAFPNIAQTVCFHPKVSTYRSLVGSIPRGRAKVGTWLT